MYPAGCKSFTNIYFTNFKFRRFYYENYFSKHNQQSNQRKETDN